MLQETQNKLPLPSSRTLFFSTNQVLRKQIITGSVNMVRRCDANAKKANVWKINMLM